MIKDPAVNLSDLNFLKFYIQDFDWYPLQNHGLIDLDISLKKEDLDFPNQITSYLNLIKNINIKNKNILDIGCGWGRGVDTIRKYTNSLVVGIDKEKEFIEYAKKTYKNSYYYIDNFLKTSLKDNSFDLIISNCSCHFFYNLDNFFINIKKVLKKDGLIIISDIFSNDTYNVFFDNLTKHRLKIDLEENLSESTIDSMKDDIFNWPSKFCNKIPIYTIAALTSIQKHRLDLFERNLNKQLKFILKNEIK